MRKLLALAACLALGLVAAPSPAQDAARPVPSVAFDQTPIEEALRFLQNLSGVPIVVDWPALELAGVERTTEISLELRDVPLRKVLQLALDTASPFEPLTFYLEDGLLHVTTLAEADQDHVTRVYDIRDLIVEVPDFDVDDADLGGGGGGGGGLGGGNGNGGDEGGGSEEERAQQIIDLIVQTVRPDVWEVNGGTARIAFFRGNLVVTAPRSVHEML